MSHTYAASPVNQSQDLNYFMIVFRKCRRCAKHFKYAINRCSWSSLSDEQNCSRISSKHIYQWILECQWCVYICLKYCICSESVFLFSWLCLHRLCVNWYDLILKSDIWTADDSANRFITYILWRRALHLNCKYK